MTTINNKPNHLHIAEHSLAENHTINWNGNKVIKTTINDFQRKNYESIAMRTEDENLLLNKTKGEFLSYTWNRFIKPL